MERRSALAVGGVGLTIAVTLGFAVPAHIQRERAAPTPGGAATSFSLYVDVGSIGGPCSDARSAAQVSAVRPWCTLDRAFRAAPAGARVLVRKGFYGSPHFTSIRRARPVTLAGAPRERPVLEYTVFENSSRLRLQGFRFTGPVDLFPGSNNGIQIVRNSFAAYTGVGVNIGPGATNTLIAGNSFTDLKEIGIGDSGTGVRANGYSAPVVNLRIVRNHFDRTRGSGIGLAGVRRSVVAGNEIENVVPRPGSPIHADPLYVQSADGLLVARNVFHDNQQAIVIFDGVTGLAFKNNLVVRGQNYGVNFQGSAPGLRFQANTVWDNAFGGVLFQAPVPGASIQNNLLQALNAVPSDLAANEDWNYVAAGGQGRHNLRRRPSFEERARLDYRQTSRSAGIDAGTSRGTPGYDLLGARRVDDPAVRNRGGGSRPYYDLGAYEFQPRRPGREARTARFALRAQRFRVDGR